MLPDTDSDDDQPIGVKQKSPAKSRGVGKTWIDKEKKSGSEEIEAVSHVARPPARKAMAETKEAPVISKKRKLHDDSPEIEPRLSPLKEPAKKIKIPKIGSGSDEDDSDTEILKRRQQESLKRIREKVMVKGSGVSSDSEHDEKPSRGKRRKGKSVKTSVRDNGVSSSSSALASKPSKAAVVKSSASSSESDVKKISAADNKAKLPSLPSTSASSEAEDPRNEKDDKSSQSSDQDNSNAIKSDNSDEPEQVKKSSKQQLNKAVNSSNGKSSTKKSAAASSSSSDSEGGRAPEKEDSCDEVSEDNVAEKSKKKSHAHAGRSSKKPSTATDDRQKAKSKSSSVSRGSEEIEETPKSVHKSKKSTKGGKDTEDKLKRYKNYLKEAGIRVNNYTKFFDGISSVKKQKEKILQHLKDNGLHGAPSIESCRKLREKRETAAEIASLDTKNIISTTGRTRGTTSLSQAEVKKPVRRLKRPSDESDEDTDNDVDIKASAYRSDEDDDAFANLRDCIGGDSD